jgi:hypothetical protein
MLWYGQPRLDAKEKGFQTVPSASDFPFGISALLVIQQALQHRYILSIV